MNKSDCNNSLIQMQLAESTVDLWKADLDQFVDFLPLAVSVLSADEIGKANRFHFAHDRDRYILARWILRILLGRYMGVQPGTICFRYNEYGKPFVVDDCGCTSIHFNISHSQNIALFVFGKTDDLGVDIEVMNPSFATMDIAKRFFSREEIIDLSNVPEEDKVIGFFDCWTRKEAYIKAKGKGLSLPLDSFSVNLLSDSRSTLRRSVYYPQDEQTYAICPVDGGDNFRAAIALNLPNFRLCQFSAQPALFSMLAKENMCASSF